MTTESFLHFFFAHNAALIESLISLILFFVAYLAYRNFAGTDSSSAAGGALADPKQLEELLKKVLERANQIPANAAPSAAGAGASKESNAHSTPAEGNNKSTEAVVLIEQITLLKKDLEVRQSEIEALKKGAPGNAAAGSAAGSNAALALSNEEKDKLENQIKELQRKLDEFDIISQDIADLSFYKEENQRLQKELAALQKDAPASTAPAAPAAAPAATSISPEVTGKPESKENAADLKEVEIPVAAAPAPPPPPEPVTVETAAEAEASGVQDVAEEDLIKEYAAMVESRRTTVNAPETAEAMPEIPAAQEDPAMDLGSLDMDKMVAEAVDLESAPSTESVKENLDDVVIDPDKLAAEANSMTTAGQEKK